MEWGGPDSQHTIVPSTRIGDAASAHTFAERLVAVPRMARGYNSISGAIDYAVELMRADAFEGKRKIIDVSGDGPQIGGRPIARARADAVGSGITINALVIDSPHGGYRGPGGIPLDVHYRRDVIGGFGAFVMVARDRRNFAEAILKKMIREIAGEGIPGDPGLSRLSGPFAPISSPPWARPENRTGHSDRWERSVVAGTLDSGFVSWWPLW